MRKIRKHLSVVMVIVLLIGMVPAFAEADSSYSLRLGIEGDGLQWDLITVNGKASGQSVSSGETFENQFQKGDQISFRINNPEQVPYLNVRAHEAKIRYLNMSGYYVGYADALSYNETEDVYTLVMPGANCAVDATTLHVDDTPGAQVQAELSEFEQSNGKTYTRYYPSLRVEVTTEGSNRLNQILYTNDGETWTASYAFKQESDGRGVWNVSGLGSPIYADYYGLGGDIRVANVCLTIKADISEKTITTISSEEELREFAKAVNDGDHYKSVTVTLANDILLTEPWTEPVGKDANHSFAGIFDGNGHKISGLDVDYTFEDETESDDQLNHGQDFGLFGHLSNAAVKNLTVAGTIDVNSTAIDWGKKNQGGYSYIGGIAAYALRSAFENCVSEVDIHAHSGYVGGIAGYTYDDETIFEDCRNYGDLTITGRNQSVGGMTGYSAKSLLRCGNYGNITVQDLPYTWLNKPPASSGGGEGTWVTTDTAFGYGAGLAAMGACTISQCFNKGSVSGKARVMGGLIALPIYMTPSNNATVIEDSYNTGSIAMTINHQGISNTYVYTAGLVGKTHSSDLLTLKNSYNAGDVTSKSVNYGTTGQLYVLYHDEGKDSTNLPQEENCYTMTSDPSVEAELLNGDERSVWKEDSAQINGGKPLLHWEESASPEEAYSVALHTGDVNAEVRVYRDEACTELVEAQEDGTYQLPSGTYYYTADADGYFPVRSSFTVARKDVTVAIPLQACANVTLRVLPEDTSVTVTDASGRSVDPEQAGNGTFQYLLNADATYTYTAERDGYTGVTRSFTAKPELDFTITLNASMYGENGQYIYGDENENQPHEITAGGVYSIGDGATGIMTIDTTEPVTLVGKGISDPAVYGDLYIDCKQAGTNLTLQDVGILDETKDKANLINFIGRKNVLHIEGVCLLDYIVGYTDYHDALIHVPYDGSLAIRGAGTLYQYNNTQGAGIGGNTGEMNGDITFAMTGSAFIKGTRQGAVIGAGASAKSSGEAPGSVTFESGTYNLETNSRGAAIGGSAGSSGASAGTSVYVRGGNININCDYTGSAVGGGGYKSGNDASGGTVYITGGSLRTYIDKNAASNENGGFNNSAFTEGINDAVITAQRLNEAGEKVYKCVFDTSDLGEGSYTVLVDGKEFYSGGRHEYAYVNESLSKNEGEQIDVSRTQDNWIPNDEPNLYFYLTGTDHTITVGDKTYRATFDASLFDADGNVVDHKVYTSGAFTIGAPASGYVASFGTPSADSVSTGATVSVPVVLTGSDLLAGAELRLQVDPSVAKITGIELPEELKENGAQTVTEDGASALLSFYGMNADVSEGRTVATVMLEGVAPGTASLNLTEGMAARSGLTEEVPVVLPEKGASVTVEDVKPAFKAHNLVLSGTIGVNFFMDLPEIDGVDYTESYVDFTVNGKTQTAKFDASKKNSSGKYYGFTCYVNSVQMADEITAVFHYTVDDEGATVGASGTGSTGDGTADGDNGNQTVEETYSIRQYVDTFKTNATSFNQQTQNLIAALANYGHYIQPFLAKTRKWTLGEDGDHKVMPNIDELTYENDVKAAMEAVKDCTILRETKNSGIDAVSFSLYLDSDTSLYFYLKPKKDFTGEVTAKLDGSGENLAVPLADQQGRYRVAIPEISAHKLGREYTVDVSADGNFTIRASALSYINAMFNAEAYRTDTDAQFAMTSLYQYYAAAAAIMGA